MSLRLEIINPLGCEGWDEMLLACRGGSIFHSAGWARLLSESYGYRPLYFTATDNGRLLALLPVMEVESVLTGKRGVSLPFSDYCEPILEGAVRFREVFGHLLEYGRRAGWKFIELRGVKGLSPGEAASSYFSHTLDLSRDEGEIFGCLDGSTQRNIRKAVREGVEAGVFDSREAVDEFCRLNLITRKRHGLPPQPLRFFRSLHRRIISEGLGHIVMASHEKKNIAGAVFLHFGKGGVYKFGASDQAYQHLRPNDLVIWEGIKWHLRSGYGSLCFGRTELENEGLRRFKTGWGTREGIINYHKYDLRGEAMRSNGLRLKGLHNRLFRRMPAPVLQAVGSLLYRHMG